MLSPLDDRYLNKVKELNAYFSEEAQLLIKSKIEIDYFVALCNELDLPISEENYNWIAHIYSDIQPIHIKVIEQKTKHDIKAIEYYLRERFKHFDIPHDHMIHFGLTSQDVNSLATSVSLNSFNKTQLINIIANILNSIAKFAIENDCIFPARTHGQLAVPTTFKKEMFVFYSRIEKLFNNISNHTFECKFGGAVGNLSAHYIAYPENDWRGFAELFVQKFDVNYEKFTTQVGNNTTISEYFDNIRMLNNILIGLSRDIWMYSSYGYLKQKVTEDEVGSSTMPQKINPINFENAEGNLELANCLFEFMSNKLQISRMQRDLTDTTVVRNIGVALGHSIVAYKSILEGLEKLSVNRSIVDQDLQNSGLLAEAYQILLKKDNVKEGYELIKNMERQGMDINSLNLPEDIKNKLKNVTIDSYVSHMRD
jgi:adenylosuccinate lyase